MASPERTDAILARSFARFDAPALGVACGAVLGLLILVATLVLVLKGGDRVGPTLALLGQFFPGYVVTPAGGAIGFAYGFLSGFAGGWAFAAFHNVTTAAFLYLLQLKANLASASDFLDSDHPHP